jgi:hypothetical protein
VNSVNTRPKDFFVPHRTPVTFATRVSYLRWLRVLETHAFESQKDFAAFAGVNYGLYMKWEDSPEPPTDRGTAKAFLSGGLTRLGATEGWLLDGQGAAPRPELWELWKARGALPVTVDVPLAKPAKKKSAGA